MGVLVVTAQWHGAEQAALALEAKAASTIFHLPARLAVSYGSLEGYALDGPIEVIRYVAECANRWPRLTPRELSAELGDIPRQREALRALLAAAVRANDSDAPIELDLRNPPDALLADVSRRAQGIKWDHRPERTDQGVEWRHHAYVHDADSFYALMATLLMDATNRSKLGRCRRCDMFFMIRPRAYRDGRFNRLYCTQEHMKQANEAGARDRQAARRNRIKAVGLLRGKGYARTAAEKAVKDAQAKHRDANYEELARSATASLHDGRRSKQ